MAKDLRPAADVRSTDGATDQRSLTENALRAAVRRHRQGPPLHQPVAALGRSPAATEVDERVRLYEVGGVPLALGDLSTSVAVSYVVAELAHDVYRLGSVPLEPADVVLDVGAHVGAFAIYVAKRHPGVTVYAVEPVPQTFAVLQRNVARNAVRNVIPMRTAVTADGRDLEMVVHFPSNSGGATGNLHDLDLPGHLRLTAPSLTLDALLSSIPAPRVKLLKIDCEGSEHEVLLGARCLDRIDHLRGEFHMNEHLRGQGYSIERLARHCETAIGAGRVLYVATRMAE